MRSLLVTTGIGAVAAALAANSASAQTVISTATTTPVTTTTTGDLRISSTGSIKPASGVAVTINSNNDVKNEGTIAITGANNSAGIVANPNVAADITNTGTITVDENYTPTDSDKDGDIDGAFAQGSNRYGIRVLGGGTFTGNIVNSGKITVEGNQSAGIAIDSPLTGSITNTADITILGADTFGLRTSAVSGNVRLTTGSITVQGQNAVGALIGGNVGGALSIQGTVISTGYRYLQIPADTSKLDADDLLQGGSAVVIAGNVAGGILLDARPADNSTTDTDEDDDGTPDAQETTASIITYGSAPAMVIGSSAQDITVGAVGTTGYGLVMKGEVAGLGLYEGISATGLSIGGSGRTVSIQGGTNVIGVVRARAIKASATAINIGAGATVPVINVSGTVLADGGGTSTSTARAIVINAGATVNSIVNSGVIAAALTGADGSAAAIVDNSGSLALVQNSGSIGVSGAAELGDRATAIDLRANTAGATVRQVAAATGKPAPSIAGNILFGSGNDTLDMQAGSLAGEVDFGGGADVFNVGGSFSGDLANSGGVALTLGNGASFEVTRAGAVSLGSLTTGTNSSMGVTISDAGYTRYNIAGSASFASGTNIVVNLETLSEAEGSYTIIDAGSLTGASNLTSSIVTLPYLFTSTLTASQATGDVVLGVNLKSADELGLNSSEAAILTAALAAADQDQPVAGIFLGVDDSDSLRGTLQDLMPEHAGGTFEAISKGSRLSAELLGDPRSVNADGYGVWLQQFGWSSSKGTGSTTSFDVSGWGATGGIERQIGALGSVGITAAYMGGRDSRLSNDMVSDQYQGGLYWRGGTGPLRGYARASAGSVNFTGKRSLTGLVGGDVVQRTSDADWSGRVYSGVAGVAYQVRSGRLSVTPSGSIDYLKLTEKGYTESGGGDAFDLNVRGRTSTETGANALVTLGYDLLGIERDSGWLRFELQGGRREILSSSLGDTVASFGDGTEFRLTPEERTSGWRGALRLLGGGSMLSLAAEVGAEQLQGRTSFNGRIGVNFSM